MATTPSDGSATITQSIPAGPLGAFIDRKPPAVSIRTNDAYPNPLAEPVPPLITADIADQVVAEPLLASLSSQARINLAAASMLAASTATGTVVSWEAADAGGTVIPARDVYVADSGLICRDLQQLVRKPDQSQVEQVTLCHQDLGDNRILWLPGRPD